MSLPRSFAIAFLSLASASASRASSLSVAPEPTAIGTPAECRVQIVREGDDLPAAYPCAEPFRPPYGRYAAWIESRDFISRNVIHLDHGETTGDQQILSPLVPVAKLTISVQGLDPTLRVIVLHLNGAGFERELSMQAATKAPISVPSGRLLVVVSDRRPKIVQVSRPIAAAPRTNVIVDLKPGAKADLVATIGTPTSLPEEPLLAAGNDGRERMADLFVPRGEESLAVWYDLEPGTARVTLQSERLVMEAVETPLRARSLSTVRAALRVRPALTIHIDATDKDAEHLEKTKATLRIRAEGDDRVLRETTIEKSMTYRFDFMPPEIVHAALEIGSWQIRKRIDLTSGLDTEATVDVESLEVSGVVTYGGERTPARLQFRRDDETVTVETDETGRYEVRLWQPGRFVAEVWLRERPSATSHQDFVRIDESTSTLDFRIPRTSYRVHVIDDATGRPIGRSMVTSFNTWIDPREGRRRIGRPVFTDARGMAELPPFRPGEVEVHAAAGGYLAREPIRFVVGEGESGENRAPLEFRLRPVGKGRSVRVLLPNGAAASGARLLSFTESNPSRALWQGVADTAGSVEIPDVVQGSVLLVRHPAAGSLVQRWTSDAAALTLPHSAAPIVVKAVRADEKPARFAPVTAWINGVAVGSTALTFLTDQPSSTDRDGIWTGRNLPAASMRLLAGSRALETLAHQVDYPWPSTVVVRVIE